MNQDEINHLYLKETHRVWLIFSPYHNIQKALCTDYCFTKQQLIEWNANFGIFCFLLVIPKFITNNLLIPVFKRKKILELPSNTFSFKIIGIPCLISWNCWNLHSSILVTHKTGSIRFNMFVFKINFLLNFFYWHTFYANNL